MSMIKEFKEFAIKGAVIGGAAKAVTLNYGAFLTNIL